MKTIKMSKIQVLKIKGKRTLYMIHHCNNGYYVTCRPKNIFLLLKEYYTDYIGSTSIHPIFLNSFYYNSVDSAIQNINIIENI